MLVLSRRQGDSLMFTDLETGELLATVKVSRVSGMPGHHVVRLAVEAPPHVRVLRGELAETATPQPAAPDESESDTPSPGLPSHPATTQ